MTEFASNNCLQLIKNNTPTWTNGNQDALIDHCLTTKYKNFDTTVIKNCLELIILHKFNFRLLTLIMKTTKRSFFYRDTRKFFRANLNKKTESVEWSPIYQQNNANSTFGKLTNKFENILNNIVPNKIGEPSSKSTKKKWLSRKMLNVINKKHMLFNIWKEKADVDTYNSYKKIIDHKDRILRRASINYTQNSFESLSDSEQQWKFIKTKTKDEDKISKVSRVRFNQVILKDKKENANTKIFVFLN